MKGKGIQELQMANFIATQFIRELMYKNQSIAINILYTTMVIYHINMKTMSKSDAKLLILACMKIASDVNDIEIGPDTLTKLYYRSVLKDATNSFNL